MAVAFDISKTLGAVQFGLGRDVEGTQTFATVPIQIEVGDALVEMLRSTLIQIANDGMPALYEPSEKYGAREYVYLPLDDTMASMMRDLHQAEALPSDTSTLKESSNVFSYFARTKNSSGQKITGLRRSTQFKILAHARLLAWSFDSLEVVDRPTFKLDDMFDVIVDAERVHILNPTAFAFASRLQSVVLAAAAGNANAVALEVPGIEFDSIAKYASTRPKAARYLASIRSQGHATGIDTPLLQALCSGSGVALTKVDGKLQVAEKDILTFLEILDRRRFELSLVKGQTEHYRAPSRKRLI